MSLRNEYDANNALAQTARGVPNSAFLTVGNLIAAARRYNGQGKRREAGAAYDLADKLLTYGGFIGGQAAKAQQLIRGVSHAS